MPIHGTIVNGQVQFDQPINLPDGTRVTLTPQERYEYPHPLAPYNADQELALLRERIANLHAGEPGVTIEEAMAAVDLVIGLTEPNKEG